MNRGEGAQKKAGSGGEAALKKGNSGGEAALKKGNSGGEAALKTGDSSGCAALTKNQLKQLKRLKTRRGRQEAGKFLLEGIKVIAAAADAIKLEQVIAAPELLGCEEGRVLRAKLAKVAWRTTRANWLEQLADTVAAQGVIAVAPLPAPEFTPERWRRVLLLDRVQDPGNVGTLLRAACAFAFDAVLALPGTMERRSVRRTPSAAASLPTTAIRSACTCRCSR